MRFRLLPLVALSGLAACSGAKGAGIGTGAGGSGVGRCSSDQQCAALKEACVAGACMQRAGALVDWSLEIRPTGSGTALTERTGVPAPGNISGEPNVVISAEPNVVARITFAGTDTSPVPAVANVVVSIPSAIAGRPRLTFETTLPSTNTATLNIPAGGLARGADVQLIPTSPADQQSAPLSFHVDPQTSSNVRLTIPTAGPWVHGTLHDAVDNVPMRAYVARAYQQGRLVSNVATIQGRSASNQVPATDGGFSLNVPATVAANPVTIELTPQGTAGTDPWFTHNPVTLAMNMQQGNNVELGVIRLPAYQAPQPFQVVVKGDAAGAPAISDAFIRAVTVLTPLADGTAHFLADNFTDEQGIAPLSLIPGLTDAARTYAIAVVSPAGTDYASKCQSDAMVVGPTTTQLPAILLPPRPRLSGTVTAADGSPVAQLTVTASRAPATAIFCGTATGPTSTSTSTDASGNFKMVLDPGTYQLDYEPPPGSPAPRHTEFDVEITANVTRSVRLPAGLVIAGVVRDPNTQPLPYATVRFFQPRPPQCQPDGGADGGTDGGANGGSDGGADAGAVDATDGGSRAVCLAPWLRAETLTDANGNYRVVVAGATGN